MRVTIIDALFSTAERTTAEGGRNRRHIFRNQISKAIEMLKALELQIDAYNKIKNDGQSIRGRRSTDNVNSLTEIMNDFKSKRDEIQTNYEWKHFNFSGLNDTEWKISELPSFSNGSTSTEDVCSPIPCEQNCKWEIIMTSSIFGALAIITYALVKIFNCYKRNQK